MVQSWKCPQQNEDDAEVKYLMAYSEKILLFIGGQIRERD